LSYLGTDIGTVTGGAGDTLVVTFTAAAGAAAIEAVIERLAYANVSDAPTASRILTLNYIDGDGSGLTGGAKAVTVQVNAENRCAASRRPRRKPDRGRESPRPSSWMATSTLPIPKPMSPAAA
jgi:hypothetical protein